MQNRTSRTSAPWLVVAVSLAGGTVGGEPAALGSWPQWLQGPSRAGLAGLPVPMEKPGLRWRAPTGGAVSQVLLTDLDGDGTADVLSLEGGRAVARRLDGGVLWDTAPLQAAQIVAVTDVDGTGGAEVLLRTKRTAALLAAPTGALLWQSPSELATDLWAVRTGDVQGDGTLELALVNNSVNSGTDATVSVFTFPDGPASGTLLAQTGPTCEGEPGRILAFGDVDGDGVLDIVNTGRAHVCAWSATTGALLAVSEALPDPMAVGEMSTADVDGDGRDEIFVFTDWTLVDVPSRRVYALGWDGGALKLEWTVTPTDPVTARHTWAPRPLVDADGDGSLDVVTSFWEDGWRTMVLAAATGAPIATLDGRVAIDVADVDGDGVPELLVAETAAQKPEAYADKALVDLVDAPGEPVAPHDVMVLPGALVRLGPFPVPLGLGAGEVVTARDTNGDSVAELLELRTLDAPDTVAAVAPLAGPVSSLQMHAVAGEPRVGVLYASGEVASLDVALVLRNDDDGDGHPELRYGGFLAKRVVGADGADVVVVSAQAGGQVAALDASAGTPIESPPTLLEAYSNGGQHPLLVQLGPLGLGICVLWRNPDGVTNLIVRALDGTTISVTPLGGKGGTYSFPLDPLLFDADGDGVDTIYLLALDAGPAEITHQLLAVDALGGLLWPALPIATPGGNVGGLAALTVGPHAPALVLTASTRRVAIGALTGAVLHDDKDGVSHYYGQPVQTDLDGDGQDEMIILGTQVGALALEPDLSVRWEGTVGDALRGPGGVVPSGAATIVAQGRTHDFRLAFLDGVSGEVLGEVALAGGAVVDLASLDPDTLQPAITAVVPVEALGPAGVPGFLVAADDGALYAVNAVTRTLIWSAQLGAALGAPALVDVDGDGDGEIVVGVGTGHVVVVDDSQVDPTSWVRENDGTGPALSDAADLDEQEVGDRVHVNWAPVADASSYVVRVRSQNGTLLAERAVEAPLAATTVDGLTLQVGQTYLTGVTSVKVGFGDVTSADEVFSDGVTVVDLGSPVIVGVVAQPGLFSPDGDGFAEQTVITAAAVDATRIATWSLSIRKDGHTVRQWTSVANTPEVELQLPWDGTDGEGEELPTATYDVVFDVADSVGNLASAGTQVTLCRPPFKEEEDACIGVRPPEPDAGPRVDAGGGDAGPVKPQEDAGNGVDAVAADAGEPGGDSAGSIGAPDSIGDMEAGGDEPGGCACDQSGAPHAGDVAPWLLLGLAALALRRRQPSPRAARDPGPRPR